LHIIFDDGKWSKDKKKIITLHTERLMTQRVKILHIIIIIHNYKKKISKFYILYISAMDITFKYFAINKT